MRGSVDRDQEPICAVSTPPGLGGISVLRVSGRGSWNIVRQLGPFLPAEPLSHRAYHGILRDPASQSPLDDVIITYFAAGKSFTGEETAEISCHGNPLLCGLIIEALIARGARPADRGEFTFRAFMNDRLDLVQAESVLALIESRSVAAARLALRQLQGDLSRRIEGMEDDLTWSLAHIEAGIDFSTEGLDVVDPAILIARLEAAELGLRALVDSFKSGRVLRDGLRVALIGRPNVGKSSLLNNLVEDERAIVTDVPGTTRDVVEGETAYAGRRFVIRDTAGLREASDRVEKIGIERSRQALSEADLVLFVIDATIGLTSEDLRWTEGIDPQRLLVVFNKTDLTDDQALESAVQGLENGKFFQQSGPFSREKMFFGSALDKTIRKRLLERCLEFFGPSAESESAVVSSARHFERLSKALANVGAARESLQGGVGPEFIALELKEALIAIQETLGKRFDDQIMDRVFKEFCIGK